MKRETCAKVRPFDPYSDMKAVADLIAVAFGDELEPAGQAMLADMRRAARWGLFSCPWSLWSSGSAAPGFVWVEEGCVVGNVSLRRALRWGGFLIGNVAVHPQWRRRGIGEALMRAAIQEASIHGARWVGLEVRAGNEAARRLYERLGFREISRTLHMLRPAGVPWAAGAPAHPALRRARRRDGKALVALMRTVVLEQMRPLLEVREEEYCPSLGRALDMWALRRREEWWVVEEEGTLCGAVRAIHEYGGRRPDQIEILVAPAHDGRFDAWLVQRGLASLRGLSDTMVETILPRPTESLVGALEEAGFQKLRTLVQMRLDLQPRWC